MDATIQRFVNGEWETQNTITTNPTTVADENGNVLSDEEFIVWAENQTPTILNKERHTPLTNIESWLKGLQARKYTHIKVIVEG